MARCKKVLVEHVPARFARRVAQRLKIGRALRLLLVAPLVTSSALCLAAQECKLARVAEFQVSFESKRAMLDATFGETPARLVLDSGAFYSFLTEQFARAQNLPRGRLPAGMEVTGVGGRAIVSVARVDQFSIAGYKYRGYEFLVGGTEPGLGSVGLIGQNFLSKFDVEYDLAHGVVRLFHPDDGCEKQSLAYWVKDGAYSEIDLDTADEYILQTVGVAELNGKQVDVTFDTGASTSIISRAAANRAGFRPDDPNVKYLGMGAGIEDGLYKIWVAPFESFKIGGEELQHTRVEVLDVPGDQFEMLLGLDFFLAHRIFVANSQRKIYFTYNGGPVFDLRPRLVADETPEQSEELTSAADFARRGGGRAARNDFAGAIADFDAAIALQPGNATYLRQRALAYFALGKPTPARADIDAAVRLNGEDVDARLTRAEWAALRHDNDAALVDANRANELLSPGSGQRLTLGVIYADAGASAEAITQFERWFAAHPHDGLRPYAYSARCQARALSGQQLDLALTDCNLALEADPQDGYAYATRALILLRQGQFARAVSDYDVGVKNIERDIANSSTKTLPHEKQQLAWALYGRGLARTRLGATDSARTDFDAALELDPQVAARARDLRVDTATPP